MSLTIPESVKKIGEGAFKDCVNLLDVDILNPQVEIGIDAFTNTPYMKKEFGDFVIFGGTLSKYLGKEENVVIPDNVVTVGENSFAESYNVVSIVIPDSVTSIANNVFGKIYAWGNDPKPKLKKLVIGNGVKSIGDSAFENCQELTEIAFGKQIETIGNAAFKDCHSLESIDLSGTSVITICQDAFRDCYKVNHLTLSESIETIGRNAFYDINADCVKLPKTVISVERSAFNCVSELIVYDRIDPDAAEASEWKYNINGAVNSPLSCAMLSVPESYVECQGNTNWRDYHITVLSSEDESIRYRVYCDSDERDEYRAMMFSAWGKNASFKFDDYDDYFIKTRSPYGRTEMALCRIRYPEELTDDHRKYYEAFLERCLYIESSAKRTAEIISEDDNVERLAKNGLNVNNNWKMKEIEKTNYMKNQV